MKHPELAQKLLKDTDRTNWHNNSIWWVRQNRDKAVFGIPDWEKLRETASQIKTYALDHLELLLAQFEQNALNNGIKVHRAANADEHNAIVLEILSKSGVKKMVKSKSMLTEECGMNHFLEEKGIEVIDTDLGERIIQLRHEPPSHIVAPAIHLRREDISETFHKFLGTEKGNCDPQYLTEAARQSLRKDFLTADAALTGVNFAIAETGEFVVCTNEGNADMGAHLAPIHIASMGWEKIVAKRAHLGVLLRVLARSSTGQAITTFSSHFRKPREGQEMHLIIVDNGRSRHLQLPEFRDALKCIRCGACMNTCPVYRRSGGHSYHVTVPGPIGSILAPNKNLDEYSDLPFASTLCGACSNVCPVKINIHDQLYAWRQRIVAAGHVTASKKIGMQAMNFVLSNPKVFNLSGKIGRSMLRSFPSVAANSLNPWYQSREMPSAATQSFRDWYAKSGGEELEKNGTSKKPFGPIKHGSKTISEPPILPVFDTAYLGDLIEKFISLIEILHGEVVKVNTEEEVEAYIETHYPNTRILRDQNRADWQTADPHTLENAQFGLFRTTVAVAENGAVWVNAEQLGQRVAPFINQYLGFVVNSKDIVPTMAEAYAKIDVPESGFGAFIAGPSKTADIEQSLVTGAHGARGLVVFLKNG